MEKEVSWGSSLGPHPGPLPKGEGVTTNSWHAARLAPLLPDLTCFALSLTNNMARSHHEFPIRRRSRHRCLRRIARRFISTGREIGPRLDRRHRRLPRESFVHLG